MQGMFALPQTGVVAVKTDIRIPYIHIMPEMLTYKALMLNAMVDIKTESHEFNERWMVNVHARHPEGYYGQDYRYVHSVLSPRVIEMLLWEDKDVLGHVIFSQGSVISISQAEYFTPELVARRLALLNEIASALPKFLGEIPNQ